MLLLILTVDWTNWEKPQLLKHASGCVWISLCSETVKSWGLGTKLQVHDKMTLLVYGERWEVDLTGGGEALGGLLLVPKSFSALWMYPFSLLSGIILWAAILCNVNPIKMNSKSKQILSSHCLCSVFNKTEHKVTAVLTSTTLNPADFQLNWASWVAYSSHSSLLPLLVVPHFINTSIPRFILQNYMETGLSPTAASNAAWLLVRVTNSCGWAQLPS